MVHSRLVISLCALCLCACVGIGISPAFGSLAASAKVQTKSAHAKRKAHRSQACAKRSSSHARTHKKQRAATGRASSFHSTSSHGRQTPGNRGCRKRRAKAHHPAGTPKPSPAPQTPSTQTPTNSPSSYGQTPTPPGAPGAQSCTDTTRVPNKQDLDEIRTAVICLVNHERAAQGETALTPNAQLEQSAQTHTEGMVSENYFEHISPQGETPVMRMRAAGYIYSSRIGYDVGENIGWGTLAESTPRAIVAAWMASPGHRANILNPHFRDTAIGVSPRLPSSLTRSQPGGIYTQDFGVITTG